MQIPKSLIAILFVLLPFISLAQDEFEMKEGDTTYIMKKYYLCLLKRGVNAAKIDSFSLVKIQEGHLAHLNDLAKKGKIVIAGPLGDDGELRGIAIYNASSLEEVQQLASDDPAVKAGRLAVEIHPWWAAKGSVLP